MYSGEQIKMALVVEPGKLIFFLCNTGQDQDQDSLLVKRRNDNHSPVYSVGFFSCSEKNDKLCLRLSVYIEVLLQKYVSLYKTITRMLEEFAESFIT